MSSRVLAVFFALALAGSTVRAQTQPGASAVPQSPPQANAVAGSSSDVDDTQPVQTFRSRSDEVNVIFTVTDKHNKFIKDLKKDQFKILDNNRPPRQILDFAAETDLPLRVGLLIDASNSIRDRFMFEQDAAVSFLHQIIRPKTDKAFVLAFDEVWDLTQDFTGDLDKLTKGIHVIRPGGGTAMWDAVFYACRDKLMKEKETGPVRRAIILVSDGDDNQSRVRPDEAIKMCERSETIIYAVSDNWTPSRGKGDQVLEEMSEATGGRVFFPPSVEEMSNSFHQIQAELRSQYALNYTPADFKANGAFRPIYLYCNDRRYQVRARKGYFAPTQ